MTPGYFLLVILYGSLVYFSDWQEHTDIARKRVEVGGEDTVKKTEEA